MREMTNQGLIALEKEEGERLFVYDDATGRRLAPGDPIRGTATAGVGHTGADVVPGMIVTKELSDRWFEQDTGWAKDLVQKLCVGPKGEVPNNNQFDALVSLAFNIGIPQFTTSSVVRMWKKGDPMAAGNAISLWTKTTIDGVLQDSPVLIARRARETAMYFTPMTSEVPKPMPQAVENPSKVITPGKVIAATTAAVPPAAVVAQNVGPALDAIQNTAQTVQQATTTWGAIKDALGGLMNGHVMTVIFLAVALGVLVFVAYKIIRRIRRGEVSG